MTITTGERLEGETSLGQAGEIATQFLGGRGTAGGSTSIVCAWEPFALDVLRGKMFYMGKGLVLKKLEEGCKWCPAEYCAALCNFDHGSPLIRNTIALNP